MGVGTTAAAKEFAEKVPGEVYEAVRSSGVGAFFGQAGKCVLLRPDIGSPHLRKNINADSDELASAADLLD